MKTLHLSIIVVTVLLLVTMMINNPVKAGCLGNPDWPSAPCYGCPGCMPSKEKQREEWNTYYQYKGAIWMEMIKTQMIGAMKNGTLEDWVTGNQSNYDAWRYYYLNDQAPFFRSSVSGLNDEPHYIPPPLQQLKTGIESKDVACKEGLELMIKTNDGLPVCVRYPTANVLLERGWAKETISTMTSPETTIIIPVNSSIRSNGFTFTPSIVKVVIGTNNTVRWINMDSVTNDITSSSVSFRSGVIESGYEWIHTFDKSGMYRYYSDIHPWLKGTVIVTTNSMANLVNDTGTITLGNQTYYFDTPNYTETSYVHPLQVTFHDVNFTLFPPGFRGGLPVGGCPGQYYWADVKFADGTAELLHIYAGSQSCADSVPIMLSNHIIPQAGLTFSDGKMRLLVRDENQAGKDIVLQKPSSMVKPFPRCNPNPAKEKLIREKQQILTDALLAEEKKYGGFENRTQNLPWSFMGYDCVDNALEVGILPQYFNSDFLPKYFEKIRSIVGNTIDVVLSPQEYALPL